MVMTLSSGFVARLAVAVLSIGLLLCGFSGTAKAQPTHHSRLRRPSAGRSRIMMDRDMRNDILVALAATALANVVTTLNATSIVRDHRH
jgi:hypothetical protein